MTLHDWVYTWLQTYKKIMVKPSTYDSYLQYATHVTCSVELEHLTTFDIRALINDMILSGCRTSTIKHMLTLVRQSLKKARALGMICTLSMLDNLEIPKKKPQKIRPLRPDQVALIFRNANKTYYGDFYKVLLYTGMRVGELIALRWADVDFFGKELHIRNTDYRGELIGAKTSDGFRIIPLYPELENIFRKKYRGERPQPAERCFLNTIGRPIVYRTLLDNWHRFCGSIGLYEPLGFHVLRHTFAHTALRGGIPVKVVSAWLGHADVRITLNIYDAVDERDLRNAGNVLGSLIEQRETPGTFAATY